MSADDHSPFRASLGAKDVEIVERKGAFRGFFKLDVLKIKHKLFGGGWSREIEREVFTKTEAAACVLYDPERDLIGLVEQFRAGAIASPYGPWCLEVVAGMMEPGETPEALITREIEEEAGVKPRKLHEITSYYSTPGACNELIHLFCAECNLDGAGGIHGLDSENEDILFAVFPAEEVFAAMLNSRMNNAATLLALQWLQLHRPALRRSN